MHQDFNDNGHELDDVTIGKIKIIRDTLEKISEKINEPMDPKVRALLEMAVDMLDEQVILDKAYDYPECPSCNTSTHEKPDLDLLFFKNNDAPSVDDLNAMFDTSWTQDDDE